MKLRFVSGQYRTKGSAALWNVALGVLHLALLGATAVYTMDSGVPWGSILLIAVLAAGWAAHSYIEPYEYSFLNDVSSRLWLSQMLFVVLILCWGALFQGRTSSPSRSSSRCCWTSFVGFSALSPLVLFRGLRNSARAAAGVATDSVPIWLYGAHWVELPLPPGAVAVLGMRTRRRRPPTTCSTRCTTPSRRASSTRRPPPAQDVEKAEGEGRKKEKKKGGRLLRQEEEAPRRRRRRRRRRRGGGAPAAAPAAASVRVEEVRVDRNPSRAARDARRRAFAQSYDALMAELRDAGRPGAGGASRAGGRVGRRRYGRRPHGRVR